MKENDETVSSGSKHEDKTASNVSSVYVDNLFNDTSPNLQVKDGDLHTEMKLTTSELGGNTNTEHLKDAGTKIISTNAKDKKTAAEKSVFQSSSTENALSTTSSNMLQNSSSGRLSNTNGSELPGYDPNSAQNTTDFENTSSTEDPLKNESLDDLTSLSNKEIECRSLSCQCPETNLTYMQTTVHAQHVLRAEHFRQARLFISNESIKSMQLIYLKEYNLCLKLIPKIGSTFMINALHFLSSKTGNSNKIFKTSRMLVHMKHYGKLKNTFTLSSVEDKRILIFARNPFSRLFSAFIDKIFIFNNLHLAKIVMKYVNRQSKRTIDCEKNVEFSDFLTYALYSPSRFLGDHYTPVSKELSVPVLASAKELIIVKQETFSTDIEYALIQANVEEKKREALHEILRCRRAVTNVKAIVRTSYFKFRQMGKKCQCLSWYKLAKRLWKSFQIQGYIHEQSSFPADDFQGGFSHQNTFLKVAFQDMERNPVSGEQRSLQRARALTEAYKSVSQKLIQEIVEQYREDFSLFQYNTAVQR